MIQNDLFDLGADLCVPPGERGHDAPAGRPRARWSASSAGATRSTTGCPTSPASCCPRAAPARPRCTSPARSAGGPSARRWPSADAEAVTPAALAYLNRLSDLLFILARAAARTPGATCSGSPGRAASPSAQARANVTRRSRGSAAVRRTCTRSPRRPVSRRGVLVVERRDDGRIGDLDRGAVVADVDDHAGEELADPACQQGALDEVDGGALGAALARAGLGHDPGIASRPSSTHAGARRRRALRQHDLVGEAVGQAAQGRRDVRVEGGDRRVHGRLAVGAAPHRVAGAVEEPGGPARRRPGRPAARRRGRAPRRRRGCPPATRRRARGRCGAAPPGRAARPAPGRGRARGRRRP